MTVQSFVCAARNTVFTAMAAATLFAPGGALAQSPLVTPGLIGRPDAPVTLTISPRFAYSHQSNDPARRAVLTDAFESWIRRHPDVKIQVIVQQGDDAVIVAKRIQDAAAGRAPDAVMTEQINYQTFYDLVQPFDAYLTANEIADYVPGVLQGMRDPKTGEVKYLQMTSYSFGLWYRRDLVDKPPTSLEDLATMAKKLQTEKGFRYGLFTLAGPATTIEVHLSSNVASIGGKLMENNAESTPVFGEGANRDAVIRVLTFWKNAIASGITPKDIASASEGGDIVSRIAAEEIPFAIGGSYMASGIIGTGKADQWAFAPMPQLGGVKPVNFQSGWSWAMFTKDKSKQALITDLLQATYTGRDSMARWGKAGGYTPTRKSVIDNYVAFQDDRLAHSFTVAVSDSVPVPNGKNRNIVNAALLNALQQVVLGAQTPEQAVDEAWQTVKDQMN